MKASVCLATHNKPHHLARVLESICRQEPGFDFEVIVVDDGGVAENAGVCKRFPVRYRRIDRESGYRNPGPARNVAYRMARAPIVIAQSDDVVHASEDCIGQLCDAMRPGHFVIATVYHTDLDGNVVTDSETTGRLTCYTGPQRQRPLFFLGAMWRKDLYAVGGNDEEFTEPGGEDRWFAMGLMKGLGLKAIFPRGIVGHHLQHERVVSYNKMQHAQETFNRKMKAAQAGRGPWISSGGPWKYED